MDDPLLCELVGRHPSLFDPKNKNFKNQDMKNNVWEEIADILEQSVDDCKKRWKSIRDTYNRRQRKSMKINQITKSTKSSKWYLLSSLTFLDNVEFERRRISSVRQSNVADNNFEEANQNAFENDDDDSLQFPQNQEDNPLEDNMSSEENLSETSKDVPIERKLEKRKEKMKQNDSKRQKIATENMVDTRQSNLNEISDKQAELLKAVETRKIKEDAIDAFFRSMAISVKQLSHSSQIKAKMEICRIVGNLELMELNQLLPVASQSSSTTFNVGMAYPTESSSSVYDLSAEALVACPKTSPNTADTDLN